MVLKFADHKLKPPVELGVSPRAVATPVPSPVIPPTATALAVMLVLHPYPVPLVHCKALAAVEQDGTVRPEGATAVRDPSN